MDNTQIGPSCLIWVWWSVIVVVLDLATKYIALGTLEYGVPHYVLPFFDITLLFNTGAAFSFLADAGGWQRWMFATVALVVSGVIFRWLQRTPRQQWWMGLALSMILGGAIGNLYDRLVHGYVVDFLSFHYDGQYFPAFNLADSAITAGAVVLIIDMLFLADRQETGKT